MKVVALVLVTLLGLAAWAGNGFERGYYIDFGSLKVSNELKGRLYKELAEACPDLVASQEAKHVVRVRSAKLIWDMEHMAYKIGLSLIEHSSSSPSGSSDRVVKKGLFDNKDKKGPWFEFEPELVEFEAECP